eukprot:285273-Amorphochlora_amoeboformis.AAC.1
MAEKVKLKAAQVDSKDRIEGLQSEIESLIRRLRLQTQSLAQSLEMARVHAKKIASESKDRQEKLEAALMAEK